MKIIFVYLFQSLGTYDSSFTLKSAVAGRLLLVVITIIAFFSKKSNFQGSLFLFLIEVK